MNYIEGRVFVGKIPQNKIFFHTLPVSASPQTIYKFSTTRFAVLHLQQTVPICDLVQTICHIHGNSTKFGAKTRREAFLCAILGFLSDRLQKSHGTHLGMDLENCT